MASEQSKATVQTIRNIHQLLDYLGTYPDEQIRYYASRRILNFHLDASYLSARDARSRSAGYFFLGWKPQDKHPIHLNGAIFTLCHILKFVAALEAEEEHGALFLNEKEVKSMRLTIQELGQLQPLTPIYDENAKSTDFANIAIKRQRSRNTEMQYFYISDIFKQKEVQVHCQLIQKNIGAINQNTMTKNISNRLDTYTYMKRTHPTCYHRLQSPVL